LENRAEINDSQAKPQTGISVERISHHGWPDSYLLANGLIEAVVVPAIGRVMQLRLKGEAEGVFWENRALDGQLNYPSSSEWINFGGDKSWPAPQSDWPAHQGRAWPPPVAFDALPAEAVVTARGLTLTSPVDPGFGIQVTRSIELDKVTPVLRIRTEYHKLAGAPLRVSVWSITQMRDPERVFMLLPEKSKHAEGYLRLGGGEPAELQVAGRLLSLRRSANSSAKIGSEAASIVWVGPNAAVRIDAEQEPGEYPDGGCVTEVYTNPDPLPYVELETLGPLTSMSIGDRIARTTRYTITPRSTRDAQAEASKLFSAR
jgi:hypothetical protein